MDISPMLLIIALVPHSMIRKTPFPYFHLRPSFLHETMGESAFNELHRAFQRNRRIGCHQQMQMIWHNHKFIKLEDSAFAIAHECFQEESRSSLTAKQFSSLPRHRRDKEGAVRKCVHATAA